MVAFPDSLDYRSYRLSNAVGHHPYYNVSPYHVQRMQLHHVLKSRQFEHQSLQAFSRFPRKRTYGPPSRRIYAQPQPQAKPKAVFRQTTDEVAAVAALVSLPNSLGSAISLPTITQNDGVKSVISMPRIAEEPEGHLIEAPSAELLPPPHQHHVPTVQSLTAPLSSRAQVPLAPTVDTFQHPRLRSSLPGNKFHDSQAKQPQQEQPQQEKSVTKNEAGEEMVDNWYCGNVSLSLLGDDDVLSPLHCFMRKYCVEAFSARPEDVATPRYGKSHGTKIVAGQVGIRCLHCLHLPLAQRPERAICYPSSLKNIYHSMETWQRRHAAVCHELPPWIRTTMLQLMKLAKSSAGGRRQYWENAAARLGMVDTPSGVRFARPPGLLPNDDASVNSRESNNDSSDKPHQHIPVVNEEDHTLVTEYLFLLMDQMEYCQFTEEDRTGGRSKVKDCPVGFPGMQCKHCFGKAGFGRYFPSSVHALALANSDRNVYNHLLKCRKCPTSIQQQLQLLRANESAKKNKRGSRKLFFSRIWDRMHGQKQKEEEPQQKQEQRQDSGDRPVEEVSISV